VKAIAHAQCATGSGGQFLGSGSGTGKTAQVRISNRYTDQQVMTHVDLQGLTGMQLVFGGSSGIIQHQLNIVFVNVPRQELIRVPNRVWKISSTLMKGQFSFARKLGTSAISDRASVGQERYCHSVTPTDRGYSFEKKDLYPSHTLNRNNCRSRCATVGCLACLESKKACKERRNVADVRGIRTFIAEDERIHLKSLYPELQDGRYTSAQVQYSTQLSKVNEILYNVQVRSIFLYIHTAVPWRFQISVCQRQISRVMAPIAALAL